MTMKSISSSNQEKDMRRYPLEATLTKKVKEWLDKQTDLFYYKAADRYQKGVSDIIICVRGIFVAAELKADNGEASPHQKLFIRQVINAGGIGGECFTLHEVKKLVEEARKRS